MILSSSPTFRSLRALFSLLASVLFLLLLGACFDDSLERTPDLESQTQSILLPCATYCLSADNPCEMVSTDPLCVGCAVGICENNCLDPFCREQGETTGDLCRGEWESQCGGCEEPSCGATNCIYPEWCADIGELIGESCRTAYPEHCGGCPDFACGAESGGCLQPWCSEIGLTADCRDVYPEQCGACLETSCAEVDIQYHYQVSECPVQLIDPSEIETPEMVFDFESCLGCDCCADDGSWTDGCECLANDNLAGALGASIPGGSLQEHFAPGCSSNPSWVPRGRIFSMQDPTTLPGGGQGQLIELHTPVNQFGFAVNNVVFPAELTVTGYNAAGQQVATAQLSYPDGMNWCDSQARYVGIRSCQCDIVRIEIESTHEHIRFDNFSWSRCEESLELVETTCRMLDVVESPSLTLETTDANHRVSDVASVGFVNEGDDEDFIISVVDGPEYATAYLFYGPLGDRISLSEADVQISSDQVRAYWDGLEVVEVGDVDGDGFDDLLIGSRDLRPYYDPDGPGPLPPELIVAAPWGVVYLIYGGPNGIDVSSAGPNTVNLHDVGGEVAGVQFYGSSQLGVQIASAGDVNHDLNMDILMVSTDGSGCPTDLAFLVHGGYDEHSNSGRALGAIELSCNGPLPGFAARFGDAVGRGGAYPSISGGNVNRDEYSDVVIGTFPGGLSNGTVYVVYGGQPVGGPFFLTGDISLANPPTGIDVTEIDGSPQLGDFGRRVSATGDFNRDDIDDIIVGYWNGASPVGSVAALIYGPILHNTYSVTEIGDLDSGARLEGAILSTRFFEQLGEIGTVGDFDGDTYDDFSFVAPHYQLGQTRNKPALLVYGGPERIVGNVEIDGPTSDIEDLRVYPVDTDSLLVSSIDSIADQNGDCLPELIIASSWLDSGVSTSAAHIIFSDPSCPYDPCEERPSACVENDTCRDLMASQPPDVVLENGVYASHRSFANAGDVDGDGQNDVIVSETYNAFLFYGPVNEPIDLTDAAATFEFDFSDAGATRPTEVTGAGDVNGDGCDDLLIGFTPMTYATDPYPGEGGAFLVYGNGEGCFHEGRLENTIHLYSPDPTVEITVFHSAPGDRAGEQVWALGDVDGDCLDDIAISVEGGLPIGYSTVIVYGSRGPGGVPLLAGTIDLRNDVGMPSVGVRFVGATLDSSHFSLPQLSSGDLNDDRANEVIFASGNGTTAYVLEGGADQVSGFPLILGDLDMSAIGSAASFIFRPTDASAEFRSFDVVGDVDGDSEVNVLILNGSQVYLVDGPYPHLNDIVLDDTQPPVGGTTFMTDVGFSLFRHVAAAGDVNGDGLSDMLLTTSPVSSSSTMSPTVFVVLGDDNDRLLGTHLLGPAVPDPLTGWELELPAATDRRPVPSGGEDVNGDCIDDIVIGGYFDLPSTSHGWIYFGDEICPEPEGCEGQPDGTACDDDDPCTTEDSCQAGHCSGASISCHAMGFCSLGACVDGECIYTPLTDGTICSDGDACSDPGRCREGVCQPGNDVICREDGNICTQATCNPETGCTHEPARDGDLCRRAPNNCQQIAYCDNGVCPNNEAWEDGTFCSDGDACTDNDHCQSGMCVSTTVVVCDDNNVCTNNSCDSEEGCQYTALPDGTDCEGDNQCIVGQTCQTGLCDGGHERDPEDRNESPCSWERCDPETERWDILDPVFAWRGTECGPEPDQCETQARCDGGSFDCPLNPPAADGTFCNDNNVCTDDEQCQNGSCQPEPGPLCDDDNVCTEDVCNPLVGCSNDAVPDGTTCEYPNDPCLVGEACVSGMCSGGTPRACSTEEDTPCNFDFCDSETGDCIPGDPDDYAEVGYCDAGIFEERPEGGYWDECILMHTCGPGDSEECLPSFEWTTIERPDGSRIRHRWDGTCSDPIGCSYCNELDDNCDGYRDIVLIDFPDCGVGICRAKSLPWDCDPATAPTCQPQISPFCTDVCSNGSDDDCDGETDETDFTASDGQGCVGGDLARRNSRCFDNDCNRRPNCFDDCSGPGDYDDDGLINEDFVLHYDEISRDNCPDDGHAVCQPGDDALPELTCYQPALELCEPLGRDICPFGRCWGGPICHLIDGCNAYDDDGDGEVNEDYVATPCNGGRGLFTCNSSCDGTPAAVCTPPSCTESCSECDPDDDEPDPYTRYDCNCF